MEQDKIEELAINLKKYVNTRYELMELKASDKISVISSEAISMFGVGTIVFLFILFSSLGLAFYLSSIFKDLFSGFFIVAGLYCLFALVMALFRKRVIAKPIKDKIIKEIFREN